MDIVAKIKTKYSYLSNLEAIELVDTAIGWFYSLRYPCEPNINKETHPITNYMDTWYICRICDEIAEKNGFNSSIGYRENGISFQFDSAWISEGLRKAIVSIAGVI